MREAARKLPERVVQTQELAAEPRVPRGIARSKLAWPKHGECDVSWMTIGCRHSRVLACDRHAAQKIRSTGWRGTSLLG
jgi:hypothetical protein